MTSLLKRLFLIVLVNFIDQSIALLFSKIFIIIPLTFLALLVNDFRKLINVIVILISGLVATFGFNYIPYKAYVIVAALVGLFAAMILTKLIKNYE